MKTIGIFVWFKTTNGRSVFTGSFAAKKSKVKMMEHFLRR